MSRTYSQPVRSAQTGIHDRLESTVRTHLNTQWKQPLHPPSVEAFSQVASWVESADTPHKVIFDSGCGTAHGTRQIAEQEPEALVIGIDRSVARLARSGFSEFPVCEGNLVLVRADLPTFWTLAARELWPMTRHYLLYPNPYPKASHLRKRWHAHPAFPDLLSLGGILELRCNWQPYALEFARAITIATGKHITAEPWNPEQVLSRFEKKYLESGHELFRVVCQLEKNQKESGESQHQRDVIS